MVFRVLKQKKYGKKAARWYKHAVTHFLTFGGTNKYAIQQKAPHWYQWHRHCKDAFPDQSCTFLRLSKKQLTHSLVLNIYVAIFLWTIIIICVINSHVLIFVQPSLTWLNSYLISYLLFLILSSKAFDLHHIFLPLNASNKNILRAAVIVLGWIFKAFLLMKREKIKYPLSCKEAATCSKDLHLVFNEFVSRSRKFPKEKKERYRQH